jgi:hypothetical protein
MRASTRLKDSTYAAAAMPATCILCFAKPANKTTSHTTTEEHELRTAALAVERKRLQVLAQHTWYVYADLKLNTRKHVTCSS